MSESDSGISGTSFSGFSLAESVWFNGRFVAPEAAAIPFYDAGLLQGVIVAERLRTFGGKLFALDRHLDRLENSLQTVGFSSGYTRDELTDAATELVARHYATIPAGGDLGLTLFVTPGDSAANRPAGLAAESCSDKPRVVMHVSPLNFAEIAGLYQHGQKLTVTDIRQVPPSCWPASLKCRSRMHYYLADREARQKDGHSRALLLDQDGFISEASTANVIFYFPERGLVVPKLEKILPGVTMSVLADLAEQLAIPFSEADILPASEANSLSSNASGEFLQLADASEAFLVSTSPCLWSVTKIDDVKFPHGGEIYARLITAWCDHVGMDIRAQAQSLAG